MKKALSLILCLVLALSLAACGADKVAGNATSPAPSSSVAPIDSATPSEAPKPVEITIGIWPEDNAEADLKTYEGYKAIMAEKYPWITVTPAHYRYTPETFLPLAESGQVPTIFQPYFTAPDQLVKNNYVADITDIVKKYGYDKAINPDLLELMTRDGKIYGLPRDAYALGLYINMNIFREAGLVDANGLPRIPKTFDELAEIASIVTEKTGKAGMHIPTIDKQGGWHFTSIAWAFGAKMEDQVNGKWTANLNSPQAVAAMQYVKDLKWKYKVLVENNLLTWGDWILNFGTDVTAMCFAAADAIDAPVKDYQMNKDAIAIASMPAGPNGDKYALMGGTCYMFSASATPEQIDACFKFLDVLGYNPNTTDEAMAGYRANLQNRNTEGIPVGPTSIKVWTNPERIDKEKAIEKELMNVNMDLYKDYYENSVIRAEEPYFTQELYGILDTVIQAVFSDPNADVQALMDAANEEFQTKYLDQLNQ